MAVAGRRVVATGTNAKEVWLEAKRKKPTARLELHKVPKGETLVLINAARVSVPQGEVCSVPGDTPPGRESNSARRI